MNNKYMRIKELSLILYLTSFLFPFIYPSSYSFIVKGQFLILMPAVLFFHYNKGVMNNALVLLFAYTLVLTFLGLPGSVIGYVSSATLGLFMVKISMRGRGANKVNVFKVSAFFYILLSGYLLYSADDPLLYGDYFGIASINYAGLVTASFGIMYTTHLIQYNFYYDDEGLELACSSNIILFLILCILLFMVFQFGSRTLIVTAPIIFIYLLSRMKIKILVAGVLCFAIMVINYIQEIYEIILEIIVPGRSSLLDLYATELAGDQERILAIAYVFESVLPSFGFCFGCSEKMSFSSLANLFAYSFPFSLMFLYLILKYCSVSVFSFFNYGGKMLLLNILLGMCFISSFVQTLMQPDFLSLSALFYVVGVGLEVHKHRAKREHNISEVSL